MPAIIALTTDFGSADSYVAQMKGVILGLAPNVRIVDVTHAVPPRNVAEAALVLAECVAAFPRGTVHLVVVDPGVGTDRRMVAAEIGDWRFVAPDNGVLAAVASRHPVRKAFELAERRWWRAEVSPTFHGRDVMAPVAAHWSTGIDAAEFGPPVEDGLRTLALLEPRRCADAIVGQVVRCDVFGNLITNVPAPGGPDVRDVRDAFTRNCRVTIQGRTISGLRRTYGDAPPGEPLALVGSHGFVEIAVNQGDARAVLDARVGSEVRIEREAALQSAGEDA